MPAERTPVTYDVAVTDAALEALDACRAQLEYIAGIIRDRGDRLVIAVDGVVVYDGHSLLTRVAKGCEDRAAQAAAVLEADGAR